MTNNTHLPHLLNETEAAHVLGMSVKTLRRWRWAGYPKLPYHKISRAVRYDLTDLEAFIAVNKMNMEVGHE